MPRQFRVAVIGRTGRGNYGHGLDIVWRQFDNVTILAVADENEQGRLAAQKRLGAKNAYADFREMLKKERPQSAGRIGGQRAFEGRRGTMVSWRAFSIGRHRCSSR